MNSNKHQWNRANLTKYYGRSYGLMDAEKAIIDTFRAQLSEMTMLDIGIGGGRTTRQLMPLVKEYYGIDYSPSMIEHCQNRFPKKEYPHCHLLVTDACNLSPFPDNTFDLIFFSYNGIDSTELENRDKVFEEAIRCGKNGSLFVFSSHNLQSLNRLYEITYRRGIFPMLKSILKCILLYLINGSPLRYQKREYAVINSGAHKFRFRTYFSRIKTQIEYLYKAGFTKVVPYTISGQPISQNQWETCEDFWIYYMCRQ